ncbi:hypothetical protein EC973_001534 [Apophysomyces ossiformis]|uniref:F-box domain-containing protein n=1 Tax=Apophysomyces ossiformis TaxID=679940 RepID=A0A8H7ERU4_9FUNG|nr:hypothetical protein EC973_001534 [Apophysomyces ossiformis]
MDPAECFSIEILDIILNYLGNSDLCALCCVNWVWRCIIIPRLYGIPRLDTQQRLHQFVSKTHGTILQQQITVLDFSMVRQYVTDDHMEKLGNCSSIRCLNLSNCSRLSSSAIHKFLSFLGGNNRTLEVVQLANCHLSEKTLAILGQMSGLRRLDLTNTMIRPCVSMDTTHHLGQMLLTPNTRCCRLENLDLSYCRWVDDRTLQNIAHGLPRLRRIDLCWCHRVSYTSILYLVQTLSRLEQIDLRHLDMIGVEMAWKLFHANLSLVTIDFSSRLRTARLIRQNYVISVEDQMP